MTPAHETWAVVPSVTGPLLARVALGARFWTLTFASYSLKAPSRSTTATRTGRVTCPSAVSAAGRLAVVAVLACA